MTESTRPTRIVMNCETGIETIIELTDEEIAQKELDDAAAESRRAEIEAQEAARLSAKVSAEAKLSALGLTPEEIAALS